MANEEHLAVLQQGVYEWNRWRAANPGVVPDLTAADLKALDLREADLRRAIMDASSLSGTFLDRSILEGASLEDADLSFADLSQARLGRANLRRARLERANLHSADMPLVNLESASLISANLRCASLVQAQLQDAKLMAASLGNARLIEAHLEGADLSGANLRGACLSSAYLNNAHLEAASLDSCLLQWAHLDGAVLHRASLHGAALDHCDLRTCVLVEADLSGASLRHADLRGVDLFVLKNDLRGAMFYNARLEHTRLRREQLGDRVGDERWGDSGEAVYAYRLLRKNFDDLGDYPAAGWAYGRERRMAKAGKWREARAAFRAGNWGAGLQNVLGAAFDQVAEWTCDYGESPKRLIAVALLALFVIGPALVELAGTGAWDSNDLQNPLRWAYGYLQEVLYVFDAVTGAGLSRIQVANDWMRLATGVFGLGGVFLIAFYAFVAANRIRRR